MPTPMQTRRGIPVSPGVAVCTAVVLGAEDRPVPLRTIQARLIHEHIDRYREAVKASIAELESLREQTEQRLGVELARIFDFHLGMLRDKYLNEKVERVIAKDQVTAEYAAWSILQEESGKLQALDSPLFRERVKDVRDLERRILGHLMGGSTEQLAKLKHDAVVVAHDLTPSQTAQLDKSLIRGLVTDAGGRTSHTAILAHALGIPAVVGLENITASVSTGDMLIVDGHLGLVIINPDAGQLLQYREAQRRHERQQTSLVELAELPAVTTDGTDIKLWANIEFPGEVREARANGAAGIGLYRTEFLYLAADHSPTEEDQYRAYVESIKLLEGAPLTLRTLDLGADKLLDNGLTESTERNPFLGCRSIRLCLQNLPLFKTQLRAILRAAVEGPVRIMFPLISSIMELRQAKMILSDVIEDLEEEGVPYNAQIPVGMMVEVPSAAVQVNTFCHEVDFISIGTNDLIQYTVAVDRGNERIANLYSAAHPAVIQLIKDVVRVAHRNRTDVSLCGEMAGEVEFVVLLLGLGLRNLSMTPPALPEVKKVIRSVSIHQCQRIARKVTSFETDREVANYLREELRRLVPEVYERRTL